MAVSTAQQRQHFGATAGAALVAHPGVDKIAFTGSTLVGKLINKAATDSLKRVSLELGGKSPVIVLPDADLDTAIKGAAGAIFFNAGQVCAAGSRLYVHRKLFDRVVEGVGGAAQSIRLGPGLDPATQMGPSVSADQLATVRQYVEIGMKEGATLACGGPTRDNGWFIHTPGTYTLNFAVCFSDIDTCLGGNGDWETLAGGIQITVINWTPSP